MSRITDHAAIIAVQAEVARLKTPAARSDLSRAKDNQHNIYLNKLYAQANQPATIDPAMLAAARDLKIQLTWLGAPEDEFGIRRIENAISGIDNFSGGPDQLAQFARARQRALKAATLATV